MNKSGFTLIEMLLVLSVISVCLFFVIPINKHELQPEAMVIYEIQEIIENGRSTALSKQRKVAMRFVGEVIYVDEESHRLSGISFFEDTTIYFNEKGHILNPKTIVFYIHDQKRQLIFNLGQGVYHFA